MKRILLLATTMTLALDSFAGETPTMGWSSWNAFRVNISEGAITHHADLIKQLELDKCGYVYVNTDDGFFGGRDETGKLRAHPKRFPNGLKPVVDHIHALGLKAGIYSDAGENTCGSIFDHDEMGVGAGFWKHEQQDADFFFKELGFDFIKIDFGGGLEKGNSMHVLMDAKERYSEIRKAIDAAKPGIRVNVCRWAYPGTWVGLIGSSWRITHDISANWGSVNAIIHKALYLSAYVGPGAFNDMDMLEVGRGLSEEEDKTHFGIWCMLTSPLLIGCDLQRLMYTKEKAYAMDLLKNRELIALDQDPLCQQAYVAKRDGETYVLVKDVKTAHGTTRAIAFLNTEDVDREMSVNLEDVELAGRVSIRDLYEHQNLPPHLWTDDGDGSEARDADLHAHGREAPRTPDLRGRDRMAGEVSGSQGSHARQDRLLPPGQGRFGWRRCGAGRRRWRAASLEACLERKGREVRARAPRAWQRRGFHPPRRQRPRGEALRPFRRGHAPQGRQRSQGLWHSDSSRYRLS